MTTDANARSCVQTGAPAYAEVGLIDHDRVVGWYGSAVLDGDTMLVLDPSLPRGPICDAELTRAIRDGRVFDPAPVLDGTVRPCDLPEAVVSGMLRLGFARAALILGVGRDGPVVPCGMRDVEDDPLGEILARGSSGLSRPSNGGVDLEAMGITVAVVHKARGRDFGPGERDAAVRAILERLAVEREFIEELSGTRAP